MSVDPTIFKAYDIRGTVPDQLNGEIAYMIGASLANYQGSLWKTPGRTGKA